MWHLVPHLAQHVRVIQARKVAACGYPHDIYRCERTASPLQRRQLTPAAYGLLSNATVCDCGDLAPPDLAPAAPSQWPWSSEIWGTSARASGVGRGLARPSPTAARGHSRSGSSQRIDPAREACRRSRQALFTL